MGALPLAAALAERLRDNGRRSMMDEGFDPPPVCKLFTPDANATWLLTEIMPREPTLAFGLCDLGLGCPELGYVSLDELAALRGSLGLPVELDASFVATMPLSAYADAARAAGRIVDCPSPSIEQAS